MELNREQIIKALEYCANNDACVGVMCPYYAEGCEKIMPKDALLLIKELTQANEQLSESYDHLEKTKDELLSERSRLTAKNERLRGVKEEYETFIGELKPKIDAIKAEERADTARKIADFMWENEIEDTLLPMNGRYLSKQEFIDQIAKEMLEGDTDGT